MVGDWLEFVTNLLSWDEEEEEVTGQQVKRERDRDRERVREREVRVDPEVNGATHGLRKAWKRMVSESLVGVEGP
jgi:hypothetical protein